MIVTVLFELQGYVGFSKVIFIIAIVGFALVLIRKLYKSLVGEKQIMWISLLCLISVSGMILVGIVVGVNLKLLLGGGI